MSSKHLFYKKAIELLRQGQSRRLVAAVCGVSKQTVSIWKRAESIKHLQPVYHYNYTAIMLYNIGFSVAEIAEMQGVKEQSIKLRLKKAEKEFTDKWRPVELLLKQGKTQKEAAAILDVTAKTISAWKKYIPAWMAKNNIRVVKPVNPKIEELKSLLRTGHNQKQSAKILNVSEKTISGWAKHIAG